MGHTPSNTWRAIGLGSALAGLSALACLVLVCLGSASARDAQTLSLQQFSELTHSESVLMSCADGVSDSSTPLSGGDLQWCADPSSPHCRPAAPPVPKLELWDNPELSVLPQLEPPAATFVWLPWPRPQASPLLTRSAADRLDRPPRA